ncbi:hypothetical protein Q1695_001531 [Nippostrongylus brasiliensis]|nr:hypothetical protein Q1695_001531 [Nippostrongylus brasiliensis]
MRVGLLLLSICFIPVHTIWSPLARLESMFQSLREATLGQGPDSDPSKPISLSDLASVGRELFSGIGRFFSRTFSEDERRLIANTIREIFNVTTTTSATKITFTTEKPRYTFPYTKVTASTQENTVAQPHSIHTTQASSPSPGSKSPYTTTRNTKFVWPTTQRPPSTNRRMTWKQITPNEYRVTMSPREDEVMHSLATNEIDSTNIPLFVKALKFTRPPPSVDPTTTTTADTTPATATCNYCPSGQRCAIHLGSFDTTDPIFQYAYSHSTVIDEYMQGLLRETQKYSFSAPLSWRSSVTPEVLQFTQSLMSLYKPSRCLVIGVFTGFALLGISEQVDYRGVVIALEHPQYAPYWDNVGLKYSKKVPHAQMSRVHIRSGEPIERSLSKLAANEPNTFDFVFLDDFNRENYLDDYEHAIRLLRSGGLLVVNKGFNQGGVLTSPELMSEVDRVVSTMNMRIKHDGRVRASLLPYDGGLWTIVKR